MAQERIMRDIASMMMENREDIKLCELENVMDFDAFIAGPVDSPYEGGLFTLGVTVPDDFPMDPLQIQFKTDVWHPNISETGVICLDILDENWVPAIRLLEALNAVQGLLRNPNPDSPLNLFAGRMMRSSLSMFNNTATTWTHHFAGGPKTVAVMENKVMQLKNKKRMNSGQAVKRLTKEMWDMRGYEL